MYYKEHRQSDEGSASALQKVSKIVSSSTDFKQIAGSGCAQFSAKWAFEGTWIEAGDGQASRVGRVIHTHTHTHTHPHTHTHSHTHTHTHAHTHKHAHTHTHTNTHTHTHTYTHTHTQNTHIHTHIRTHTSLHLVLIDVGQDPVVTLCHEIRVGLTWAGG